MKKTVLICALLCGGLASAKAVAGNASTVPPGPATDMVLSAIENEGTLLSQEGSYLGNLKTVWVDTKQSLWVIRAPLPSEPIRGIMPGPVQWETPSELIIYMPSDVLLVGPGTTGYIQVSVELTNNVRGYYTITVIGK